MRWRLQRSGQVSKKAQSSSAEDRELSEMSEMKALTLLQSGSVSLNNKEVHQEELRETEGEKR